jgi:hypothetical protein
MQRSKAVGILAYGSLINDPGDEINPFITERISCITPFNVEYSRKSKSRDYAPTLIPVGIGGAAVNAVILVLNDSISLEEAENMLWRRETRETDTSKKYKKKLNPGKNSVQVKILENFQTIDKVIYTSIASNLDFNSPSILADLAIQSILSSAGNAGTDGIRYLLNAKANGITTPFSAEYENNILEHTKTTTLEAAIHKLDSQRISELARAAEYMFLFDKKERTLQGPADYNADIYAYYNDSARLDVGCVRDQLEIWFAKYPQNEKEELKSRVKATFHPAIFELFIFALFTELGYSLEIHPEIPGTTKRPDYFAKKGNDVFYIEVKFMTMLSQNEQSLERRKNAVLDAINKIDASNFLLKLEDIAFKDSSQPSGKDIIRYFNREIANYSPDDYTERLLQHGFDGMPEIIYEDDKIKITTKLLPKSPLHRGTNSRSIGAHPTVTQIGNDSEDIKGSLESKATRYGNLNAPYIICLNKQSVGLDLIEVQEALYGSLQISWSDNQNNRDEKMEFTGNGFFGSKNNPKFTRVSGVYITNANTANLATTAEHAFRHNPFAKYPINLSLSSSVKDIFEIPDNYPYSSKTDNK